MTLLPVLHTSTADSLILLTSVLIVEIPYLQDASKDPGQTSTFVLANSVVGTEITDVQLYI